MAKGTLEKFIWDPTDPRTVFDSNNILVPYTMRRNMVILPPLEEFPNLEEGVICGEMVHVCRVLKKLTKDLPSRTEIAAPIAFGKSTVASLFLYPYMSAELFLEDANTPHLKVFAHDSGTYALPFQLTVMRQRSKDTFMQIKDKHFSSISDKAQEEEKMFFRVLQMLWALSKGEVATLDARLNSNIRKHGHPHLVMELYGSPMTGYIRSLERGRDYEVSQKERRLTKAGIREVAAVRKEFLTTVKEDAQEHYKAYKKKDDAIGLLKFLRPGNVTLPYETVLTKAYRDHFEEDLSKAGYDPRKKAPHDECYNGALLRANADKLQRNNPNHLLAVLTAVKYGLMLQFSRQGHRIKEDKKEKKVYIN